MCLDKLRTCNYSSKKQCPICFEEKKLTTQCKICTDTRICQDCCLSLCEKGLCARCPICRQPNWKKPKKSQILPILKLKNNNESNTQPTIQLTTREDELEPSCSCNINCLSLYTKIKTIYITIGAILGLIALIYGVGFMTVLVFSKPDDWKFNKHLYWISMLVGLFWFGLLWTPCCCGNTLRNIYCNRETY